VTIPVIEGQIAAVLDDIGTDAVKIGMLHSEEVVQSVRRMLLRYNAPNIVLDPVMVSTSGHRLIEETAIHSLRNELIPLARIITPNIPEAEILLGEQITHQDQLPDAAQLLSKQSGTSVLLKAGHLTEDKLVDILYDREENRVYELPSVRIHTCNTHGTGCTLSSALASMLARGYSLAQSAERAKDYINQAIMAGAEYKIGQGFGPVKHFYAFW